MKLYAAILLAGILSVSGLHGCGGGGGNPGLCSGSAEVCGGNNSTSVPQNAAAPGTPVTCASFATQQEAQTAFVAGATQLDPNGDGIACNE